METTIKVSEESADLIAILKQFNIAYDMFVEYLDKHYGKKRGKDENEERFYDTWCDVTSVVEKYLSQAMFWELRESHFTSI